MQNLEQQVVAAMLATGSQRATARRLNISRATVQKYLKRHETKGSFGPDMQMPEPPRDDESVDELLERKKNLFRRKKAGQDFRKLIEIAVKHSGPVAITFHGDPHVDDDGCDIEALEREVEIIDNTPAMYSLHVGDITNNWVGRLARLYAHQTTTARQAIKLTEWLINRRKVLAVVGGNHDCWNQGMDILGFIMRQNSGVLNAHGVRLALNFENGKQIRIHARHDFKGRSQYNPNHGHRREQLWGGNRDHIYVSGHRHSDAASVIPQADGTCSWSFLVSGYKVIDDYAHENGFHETRMGPSVTVVINPNAGNEAELVKPFWDVELAADYLTFLRGKR